jgi:hypothetical protein
MGLQESPLPDPVCAPSLHVTRVESGFPAARGTRPDPKGISGDALEMLRRDASIPVPKPLSLGEGHSTSWVCDRHAWFPTPAGLPRGPVGGRIPQSGEERGNQMARMPPPHVAIPVCKRFQAGTQMSLWGYARPSLALTHLDWDSKGSPRAGICPFPGMERGNRFGSGTRLAWLSLWRGVTRRPPGHRLGQLRERGAKGRVRDAPTCPGAEVASRRRADSGWGTQVPFWGYARAPVPFCSPAAGLPRGPTGVDRWQRAYPEASPWYP